MDLQSLQADHAIWLDHNFGQQRTNPHQGLLGVVEEIGELAHAHLKLEQGIRLNENHVAKARDAVGDLVIFLAGYCTCMGWDLAGCVSDAWAEVSQRDWVKYPTNGRDA